MTRQFLRIATSVTAFALTCAAFAAPEPVPGHAETPRAEMIRYETVLQANPDDLDARLGLAGALMALGEYDRAEKMADLVLKRRGDMEARLVLAEALLRQGRLDEATEAMSVQESLSGDAADLNAVITAELALSNGDVGGALKAIEPVMSHPRYAPLARVLAARGFYAAGELGLAKRLVDGIIADGGDSVTALLFRARLALLAGDPGTAIRLADGIDALDRGNVSAGAIAVEAMLREGRVDDARARLDRLRPTSSEDPRPAYLRAILLAAEGQTREAAQMVSSIEEWLGSTSGGAIFLADLKEELGFAGQAETILRKRHNADPTDIAIVRELTAMLDAQGRAEAGDEIVTRSLRIMPNQPILLRLQADRLAARGEFDAAISVLATIPGEEGTPDLFNVMGEGNQTTLAARMAAAIRAGDPALAIRLASEAPDSDLMVQNMLAAALATSGEESRARTVLDSIIARDPNFLAAVINRAGLDPSPTAVLEALKLSQAAGASSAAIYRQLAVEAFVVGETDLAVEAAHKATMVSDHLSVDLLMPARIELAMGQYDAAIQSLSEITAHHEMTAADQIYRLWLLSLAGAPEEAAVNARDFVLPSRDRVSGMRLADIFNAAEEYVAEAEILAQLLRATPQDATLTEQYLVSLAKTDLPAAHDALKLADELPDEVRDALGIRLLISAGQQKEARTALEALPLSTPTYVIALELAETEDDKEALLDRMAAYSAENPEDFSILVLLSGVAIEVGDKARAEKALATALATMPGNPAVLNNLALTRKEKSPLEALRLAAEAYQAAPQEPAFAETYVSILVETSDSARAGRIARRTLLADPTATELKNYSRY